MPRRALAASGVAKLLLSACTTVAPASRVIVAVMRTLAASTMMTTALGLTPATLAMELCRLEAVGSGGFGGGGGDDGGGGDGGGGTGGGGLGGGGDGGGGRGGGGE
eukprot:scaffold40580_cov46-Phaeocystis_antarctica.AAC.1